MMEESWRSRASSTIRELAGAGRDFTADDVTFKVGRPPAPNELGAAFREAAAQGVIRHVGYKESARAERHGSRILVWRGSDTIQQEFALQVHKEPEAPTEKGKVWRCLSCRTPSARQPDTILIDIRFGEMSCVPCGYKRRIFRLETA